MIGLLVVGLCILSFGMIRTFVVYVGIIATIATMILMMVSGGGLSYLFWNEQVHAFQTGEFWASMFTERSGFDVWQAFMVPIIFVVDLLRISIKFVFFCPNIFSIGIFGYWCYLMYIMWSRIILPIALSPNRRATT